MKGTATALGFVLLLGTVPVSAFAYGQTGAVVAVHAQSHDAKGLSCGGLDPSLPCSEFATSWPVGQGADVYLVVGRADGMLGISGLSCGIAYDPAPGSGVDLFGTTVCSDLDYPNAGPNGEWPASHGGNRFIWVRTTNCQRIARPPDGTHAVACGFYVYAYSPDAFSVIQNENLQFGPELLVVDCNLANSNLAYPDHAGSVGFGRSGSNPCSGAFDGDITPPVLESASGTAGTASMTLQFSEPVSYGGDTESNYVVYPTSDPAAVLAVTHASVATATVTLTLGENLEELTSYSVSVTGVLDRGGNPVAPGSTVSFTTGPLDTTPPTLVSASGSPGTAKVTVHYSEDVSATAATASNYSVHLSGDPGSSLPVVSASRSGSTASLTLGDNLAYAATYSVEVSNVADLHGNVIAPGSTVDFRTTPADTTPPVLVGATGTAGTPMVTVAFSEAVGTGGNVASNYTVYPAGDPAGAIPVVSASYASSTATLMLASNLVLTTTYTVEVSNVADRFENVIAPGSTVDFTPWPPDYDTTPPVLAGASGAAGSAVVTVTFNEPVGTGAAVASNYDVRPGILSRPITVLSATVSGSTVTLNLFSTLAAATTYTVSVSNVEDLAGNVIVPNSSVTFSTSSPPTGSLALLNAWGVRNANLVWVTYSEAPETGADVPANYQVFPSADSSGAITVFSASVSGSTATLTLGANLAADTRYTVEVSDVQDAGGNFVPPGTSASFEVNGLHGQQNAVVAVHAQAHDTKGLRCGDLSPTLSCDGFATSWPTLSGADVYLVVAAGDASLGVSGVSLGVEYGRTEGERRDGMGVDVFGYVSCSDYEYPTSPDGNPAHAFPASGGGNRILWDRDTNCQRTERGSWGVHAVACAMYVYAYDPDLFTVDMNRTLPTGPEFMVMDCSGPALTDLQWPARAGFIDFGGDSGYNPCMAVTPVVRTTWGRLKNQYH